MNNFKCIGVGLAVCSMVFGLIAARYWYRSSVVKVDPGWTAKNPQPVDPQLIQMDWNSATLKAIQKSSDLNKVAALWTAISVGLGGLSGIIGSVG
jgi:hypothetical protein